MSCTLELQRWLENTRDNEPIQKELLAILKSPMEIEARFSSMLEFGTAGLRGLLGAGLNRMNIYTVRHATQGLANLIDSMGEDIKKRGVAIANDSRNMSREFALQAAGVLAAKGIAVYLFDELRPSPELSFAVRELHCIAGINITASHNPKEYNGYKVYWEDGAQLPPSLADKILKEIRQNDIFCDVFTMPLEDAEKEGLLYTLGRETDEEFIRNVLAQSLDAGAVHSVADSYRIVYTPFHGAGYRIVPEVLRRLGFNLVIPVPEQMIPDGNFPTVQSPNPEDPEGFALAIELAKREDADLIIGTDPDSDRIGVLERESAGKYRNFSGNQIGILLTDYIIRLKHSKGALPEDAAVVTTIVSTRMTFELCRRAGVAIFETFTGFKCMAEKIREFEETGNHSFLFAFEESYGYLAGTFLRDKDAVTASMLVSEMAAHYKAEGTTLSGALRALYERYGWFAERTISIRMDGFNALYRMKSLMERLREEAPRTIGGTAVLALRDYLSDKRTDLATGKKRPIGMEERSDVLLYELEDGSLVAVRPSGTEPKIKLYLLVKGNSETEAKTLIERYEASARRLLGQSTASSPA